MERFWKRVKRGEGCWLWTGYTLAGYGRIRLNGKRVGAHRLSWELTSGPIPDGLCVLHRCDNPRCVRPDHLFLGTQLENIADMKSKGRARAAPHLGEKHPGAKLTSADVLSIRARPMLPNRLEATRRGVTIALISKIRLRHCWTHI